MRLARMFSYTKELIPMEFQRLFAEEGWLWNDVPKSHQTPTALRLCLLKEYTTFIRDSGWQDKWSLPQGNTFDVANSQQTVLVPKWNIYVPKLISRCYVHKLRQGFHFTKRFSQKHACYSVDTSLIRTLLDNYTVTDPLFLLQTLYPETKQLCNVIRSGKFGKHVNVTDTSCMLVYTTLNIYFNWIHANNDQFVISDVVPSVSHSNGDLRCSHCNKCQTFRSSLKKGNPRHNESETSIDMMRFVSSCCSADLLYVPYTTPNSSYVMYTPLKQMYTNCVSCSDTVFSEVVVAQKHILKCQKCSGLGRCHQTGHT